jgi:hypothetical protein
MKKKTNPLGFSRDRKTGQPPADAKQSIQSAFDHIGGVAGLSRWALSHKAEFYAHIYPKLLPLPPSAAVQVNVNTEGKGEYYHKIHSALAGIIAARKEAQRQIVDVTPPTGENSPVDPPSDAAPAGVEFSAPEPVVGNVPTTPEPPPRAADAPNIVRPKEFTPREPTTTELFYERGGYGSERMRPKDWGPI